MMIRNKNSQQPKSVNRCGSILTMLLILLPVLILFVGFAIDYAYMQRARTELRRATDLAAKAAAMTLFQTDDINLAEAAAINIASQNLVCGEPLTLDASSIEFGLSAPQSDGRWDFVLNGSPRNAVRIIGSRESSSPDGSIRTFFGLTYGVPNFEPSFSAVAAFANSDIVLVLDRSSSMKLATTDSSEGMGGSNPRLCDIPWADSRWIALENAVGQFLAEMNQTASEEQVGVVTFASDETFCGEVSQKVTLDQDLDIDLTKTTSAISTRSINVWTGRTDIKAGIEKAREVLKSGSARDSAVKIMIVFTDGQYTEESPLLEAQAAAAEGMIIYTITFSPGANQTDMIAIANAGNGRHFHADTPGELNGSPFMKSAEPLSTWFSKYNIWLCESTTCDKFTKKFLDVQVPRRLKWPWLRR